MISQTALAGALGYLSIAFWLCAQLPQVIKNATLRSCEGLALPFLINWLFGGYLVFPLVCWAAWDMGQVTVAGI